jgi:hypothetical protein
MLESVIDNYFHSLEEREFDEPFMAMLRGCGFHDIQFLHGSFEFGKDFIAKKTRNGQLCQYAFQTKAGDLDASAWRGARGQIDEMRMTRLAHPAFDASLPRIVVLVTTGQLVGQAPVSAQEYQAYIAENHRETFEVWDRGRLRDIFVASPELGLAGTFDSELLGLVARIDDGSIDATDIERFSRRWIHNGIASSRWRAALEAAVVCNRLRRMQRLDLACIASLALLRSAWVVGHDTAPPDQIALGLAEAGKSMFVHYARDVWRECTRNHLDSNALYGAMREPGSFVTYPVRCLRLIEILGLLGLACNKEEPDEATGILQFVASFISAQPGAAHPISDQWAASLIPAALLVAQQQPAEVAAWLVRVIAWVGDHYDGENPGLARFDAVPSLEVEHLLGAPLEHIQVQPRDESYIATVVLDLAALMQFGEVFETARNEFQATGVIPELIHVQDTPGQYLRAASDIAREVNPPYDEGWRPSEGWRAAPHHIASESLYLDRIERPWDLIAIGSVLRDRHFLIAMHNMLHSGAIGR